MKFTSIKTISDTLIHCSKIECPLRSEEPGEYPKPPAGPVKSEIVMIFENPGDPHGKNLQAEGNLECQFDIHSIALAQARKFKKQGQENWLFRTRGLNKGLWSKHEMVPGLNTYSTDSHKCFSRKGTKDSVKRAAIRCCLEYLSEEIRLVKPKVLMAFGDYARDALGSLEGVYWVDVDGKRLCIRTRKKAKRLVKEQGRLYVLLPHPDGFWKRSRSESGDCKAMNKAEFELALDYCFKATRKWLRHPPKRRG